MDTPCLFFSRLRLGSWALLLSLVGIRGGDCLLPPAQLVPSVVFFPTDTPYATGTGHVVIQRAVRLVPGAVLLCLSVFSVLLLMPSAPPSLRFSSPPASLPSSEHFLVVDAAGVSVGDSLPVLDPGLYRVRDFGDRIGGRWWPAEFDIVVYASMPGSSPGSALLPAPWWPLGVVLGFSALAAAWAFTGRRLLFAVFVTALPVWVWVGSVSLDTPQYVGLLVLALSIALAGVFRTVDPRARALLSACAVALGLSAAFWVPSSPAEPAPALSVSLCESFSGASAQDCWAALALSQSSGVPEDATGLVRSVLSAAPPQDRLDSCRRVGFAVGGSLVAASDSAEQVRAKYKRVQEVCDFSILHGMAAAAISLAGPPDEAARTVCSPAPAAQLSPAAFASQCWHGAGQGLARSSGLDTTAIARFCLAAPEEGDQSNCAEGALVELVDSLSRPGWGVSSGFIEGVCASWPQRISSQCWRYVAWALHEEGLKPGLIAPAVRNFCVRVDPSVSANCWRGVAEAIVLDTAASAPPPEVLLDGCAPAPVPSSRQACEQRVLTSYASGYFSRLGRLPDLRALCSLVPTDTRQSVCEALQRFALTTQGKGSTSADISGSSVVRGLPQLAVP